MHASSSPIRANAAAASSIATSRSGAHTVTTVRTPMQTRTNSNRCSLLAAASTPGTRPEAHPSASIHTTPAIPITTIAAHRILSYAPSVWHGLPAHVRAAAALRAIAPRPNSPDMLHELYVLHPHP